MNKLIWNFPGWFHKLVGEVLGVILVRRLDDEDNVLEYYWDSYKEWFDGNN